MTFVVGEATSDSVTVKQSGSADATLHAKKNSCTDGSDGDHRDVKKDAAVKESCDPVGKLWKSDVLLF